MDRMTLRQTAFAMRYRTDPEARRRVVPEPLEIVEPVVNYEFIGARPAAARIRCS